MNERLYSPDLDIGEATYLLYEAKRFSERAEGVGQEMLITIHPCDDLKDPEQEMLIVHPDAIQKLEQLHNKYGLQPTQGGRFRFDEFFRSPTKPEGWFPREIKITDLEGHEDV